MLRSTRKSLLLWHQSLPDPQPLLPPPVAAFSIFGGGGGKREGGAGPARPLLTEAELEVEEGQLEEGEGALEVVLVAVLLKT